MNKQKTRKKGRIMWISIYIIVFIVAFGLGIGSKVIPKAWTKDYKADWNASVGTVYKDISYGETKSNQFDLYVPSDNSKKKYGLVVYLHAGGFTSGDKADDHEMLKWLCSKGYVAAGINYTLKDDAHPKTSIHTQSLEIKKSIPSVIEEAKKLGYDIDEMVISGGSAGHCLAMLYAYRDAKTSPVPVKMVFGAVGPSSFYPEDWDNYGFDQNTVEAKQAAAGLFSVMAGREISSDLFTTPTYDQVIKDISALLWIDDESVPSLMAYGKYDKVQPFKASLRLDKALTKHNVPHDYIVFEHSGHGLQNDDKESRLYSQKIEDYLNKYMPVK
ncbi:MAG: alpha/beta hydrolase [Coprobacillus cateniformis]|uniref:alpha/beta hydrolase n=1 Tax=Longibaculum muris TaxID=1796628 RepID=UPI0029FF4992|nr:alpha/beta hydrolase [Coprobacillus cateniformis]